jgi:hypothetical protein
MLIAFSAPAGPRRWSLTIERYLGMIEAGIFGLETVRQIRERAGKAIPEIGITCATA